MPRTHLLHLIGNLAYGGRTEKDGEAEICGLAVRDLSNWCYKLVELTWYLSAKSREVYSSFVDALDRVKLLTLVKS